MTTRRRRLLVLLALLTAAVVIAGLVLTDGRQETGTDAEAGDTSAFDPSVPTSTQTPPPADSASPTEEPSDAPSDPADPTDGPTTADGDPGVPDLTPEQDAEITAGTSDVLDKVLEETAPIDPAAPADVVGELSDLAAQGYLSEIEAERLEFEAEGWTRSGSYSYTDAEVIDHSSTGTGEVATVRVCVDSSALVVRRADGGEIEAPAASTRSWNLFVFERSDSAGWRLVGRSFPDNPAC